MQRTEFITRGDGPVRVELAPGVELRVFADARLGSRGLCTGTAIFRPGAELPYHRHPCSEAVTVVRGAASFAIEGRTYRLTPYDAIHVPAGAAHRTQNTSDTPTVLLSSFASDTPGRELVPDESRAEERSETGPEC